ncbi:unnamed protein product [Rotaria magnacalcarata]|uniref:PDZ domain-containing protein n=1 Tax=Rotaria magnacalcarata TaxID=392030 RepID=A0A816C1N2_9BILA|nr:unnamed protein product [Rotaria magnacalcarata]
MFKCFPIPFCNRNLEQIDKRHCNLTTVPDDVLRYTRTLEELLLDANQLQDLPKGVYRLTQLRRLTFSDNEIQYISPEIGQLVNLEELDCSRNDIAEIPDNIRHCRLLQRLDCSGNPLANNLPAGIIHLRQLCQLTLNDVSLAELPRDIGSLSNLRLLEIRENLLKVLPDSLVQLPKLESLDLGSNVIEQLPNHMGNLQSLKELWLDSNEIHELPADIGRLKRLQCLDVSENKLTYLPEEIGDLESLTNLELSSNQIESLPSTIGQLKHRLLILKINSNSLTKLCEEIGQCLALTELILTENALTELPVTIGNLKKLSNLNVDRNQLTHLPVEISGCESLGMLSLRDNRVTQIPSELSKLKHLHVLDLSGNRLLNLPCTLLECDLKAIWLAENQAHPMLKFATDIDAATGEKVITCYLLPQQQYTTSSMENLLNASKSQNLNNEQAKVLQVSTSPTAEHHESKSPSPIDDRHERTGSVKFADQSDEGKESSLQRHNTPHPKDLRTWRNKIAKKFHVTDGNLLHHEHHPYQPNANKHGQRDSTQTSLSSQQSMSSTNHQHKITIDPSNHIHESIDYVPPEISADHQDSDDEDDEHAGEQVQYIEKHVEFTDEIHNNEETTKDHQHQQKLHRRDTPHHLKNKRIINKNNDAVSFDKILSHSSTKSSLTSPGKDVCLQKENQSRSSSIQVNTRPMTFNKEQITINIRRPPNTGLGISIAGGSGSTPFKDNDDGIFLTKINEEGPASQAGLLVGDKLLSVNGISLVNAEHSDAVAALKKAGDNIEMIIMREILQSSDDYNENNNIKEGEKFSTVIQRNEKKGGNFGFSVAGGNQTITTNGSGNENLYVSRVNNQDKISPLAVGDRLLSINGYDTGSISHDQAIDIINNGGHNVELVVYREKFTNGNQNMISTTNIDNTIEEARVSKGNGPMGLSIVGGTDQACPPFGLNQRGVFVSKILPNGSASRTNLRIGDRILKVNNRDVSQATHLEAVEALLQPTSEVILLVHHDPQPAGLKEVTLTRHTGEPLGIRINGGVDGKRVNPDDPEDDGIFVTEVKDGSPASGILTVGTRILEAFNNTFHNRWLCFSHKSLSTSSKSSSLIMTIDYSIEDYCETNLDDMINFNGTVSYDKSSKIKNSRSSEYLRKTLRQRNKKQTKSNILPKLFHKKNKIIKEKEDLTCTQQILVPMSTSKHVISTSFSETSLSSSKDIKQLALPEPPLIIPVEIIVTPEPSYKSLSHNPPSPISTHKSSVPQSNTSSSNYHLKSSLNYSQYSFEEGTFDKDCPYCSGEDELSIKTDSNHRSVQEISQRSFNILHASEVYLSSNNSMNEQCDSSSVLSAEYATIDETKQLHSCEINEIMQAIHSTFDNNYNQRDEILDALASSLEHVAEETSSILQDEEDILTDMNIPEPAQGLDQIFVRAVIYEIMMRLLSFHLLVLITTNEVNNQSLFGARLDDAQKWLSIPSETIHLLICHGFKIKEVNLVSPTKSSKPIDTNRSSLTQQSNSPIPPARQNGVSSSHNVSLSPKVTNPVYANTNNKQQISPQPPPVPVKPKYRTSNTQFMPINGGNHKQKPQQQPSQNGFEIDESDFSVTESERSFKDKKKFFESGFKDSGPKPKPRQFKYINEHELLQMKQEEDQKVKTMSPTELLQSRAMYAGDINDSELMQTTLSQYQTPNYLAKPEDDQTDEDITQQQQTGKLPSTTRMHSHERDTASAHTMPSKLTIDNSGMN